LFLPASSFLRHIHGLHYPRMMYQCPHQSCGKAFPRSYRLHQHILVQHGENIGGSMLDFEQKLDPPEKCLICQIPLSSWEAFRSCVMKHS
jgi:hypothetical protein